MTFIADTPTLGLLIWTPIGLLVALICIAVGVWGIRSELSGNDLHGDHFFIGIGAAIAGLVALAIVAVAMWPYKHDYHFWVPKGGEVQQVSKRLVPAGDSGMQEKIVFLINGQPYGVLDTRASLVKKGDVVDIACKRAYEWGSRDHGWDCRWNGEVNPDA